MGVEEKILLSVSAPLHIQVRTTVGYWEYLIAIKHPVMKGKEDIVRDILEHPDVIRQSRTDKDIFLYYKQSDKLYCVVVRHVGGRVS
jgi:hypothetical protein